MIEMMKFEATGQFPISNPRCHLWIAYPLASGGWRGSVLKNTNKNPDALRICEPVGGHRGLEGNREPNATAKARAGWEVDRG
jgi:hypothetical protein